MPPKKSAKSRRTAVQTPKGTLSGMYGPAPLVSLAWMLGAALTAVAIGTAAAYLVLCVIFYQNQAMMIFHPSKKITATPASAGLTYQEVKFDPGTNDQTQLTGWWIPAAKGAPFANDTILYLHGTSGSLSNSVAQIQSLHALGINVFAVDYRGFGKSASLRPTEQSATADALAAWKYLTASRNVSPASIVTFGEGAGATFATHLAARQHPAGLVLAQISPTAHTIFEQDQRARLLPLFLLAKERMDPAPSLAHLKTPKLFLTWPAKTAAEKNVTDRDYAQAAAPKQLASLPDGAPGSVTDAMQPFLHQVLPAAR